MKFLVKSVGNNTARLGILEKSESLKFETPLMLLYTKAASIPFLSREVFSYISTDNLAFEIPIETTHHMVKSLCSHRNGVVSFASLNSNSLSVATVKNTGERSPSGHHERDTLSLFTKSGRKTISADEYMNLIDAHRPDIFHTLCDGDTSADCSKKRVLKSVERTESFFEICLKRYQANDALKKAMLIAPIEGGYNIKARELTIQNHQHPEIGGYFLDGFHNNGCTAIDLKFSEIKPIVSRCTELLPDDKVRLMLGAYNPITILELINVGIDVFDNSYAFLATTNRCALSFNFDVKRADHINSFDMDLSEDVYKEDFLPILKDCECLACKKHTRAYLNHLVNTKELLASILLMIHNTHHFIEFFKMIRIAIESKQLRQLIDLVKTQYDNGSLVSRNIATPNEKPKTVSNKRFES